MYGQGYGVTEEGVLLKSKSVLPASSISKLITAIGVMKLVEDGQLTLYDFVFGRGGILSDLEPFPSLETADQRLFDIRVIHLLQHTSGLQSHMSELNDIHLLRGHKVINISREMGLTSGLSLPDVIRYSAGQRLVFPPGSRFSHSNLGYSILGEVIARKSRSTYSQFIYQRVLEPLGMWQTTLMPDYEFPLNKYNSQRVDVSKSPFLQASLGWHTTVYDLLRLIDGLQGDLLVSSASRQTMMSPPPSPVSEHQDQWYGMGLHVGNDGSWWQTGDPHTNEVLIFQPGPRKGHKTDRKLRWAVLCTGNQHRNLKNDFSKMFASQQHWPNKFPAARDCEDVSFVDKCGRRVLINSRVPTEKFKSFSNALLRQSYRPKWISVYNNNGTTHVSSIWQEGSSATQLYLLETEISGNDLRKKIDELQMKKFALSSLEPYYKGRQIKYIAVFSKGGTGYQRYALETTEDIFERSKQFYTDDLSLIPTGKAVLMDGNRKIVSFVFDKVNVTSWRIYDKVPLEDMKSLVLEMARHGRTLSYTHSYSYHDDIYFSTIFSGGETHRMHLELGVDRSMLQDGTYNMKDRGFSPQVISSYTVEEGFVKFMILWTKDNCV
ncbi:uncharacterized protein [Apostichopus japonicus]